MIKAALFDLDGTLFDTEGQYTVYWGAVGRKYHPEIPHFEQTIKGTTLKQIFERHFPNPDVQRVVEEELNDFEAHMNYAFYPGSLDFIRDLRLNGVKCAVVTSSNLDKMDKIKCSIPDFYDIFDRVLTAEDFEASKPDPDCFIKGMQCFGATKEETVVFEDAFTGLQAGMSSGAFTIGLPTTNSREAITGKCHYILDSWEGMTYQRLTEIVEVNR